MLKIRDVYPGSRIRIFSSPDPGSTSKSILTQKIDTKLSEILSGLFVHPAPDFYQSQIPDPGVKKAPDPGSGSATKISLFSVRNTAYKLKLKRSTSYYIFKLGLLKIIFTRADVYSSGLRFNVFYCEENSLARFI